MLKKINVQDAVGTQLAHDITEIRPGEFKGAAFRKGHTVCNEDICHLQKLGKNHLYVIYLADDEIHENEAAALLAGALAGEGVTWENNPKEITWADMNWAPGEAPELSAPHDHGRHFEKPGKRRAAVISLR